MKSAEHPVENPPHAGLNPEAEWFGYKRLSPEEKTLQVIDVFSSVADKYDIMNDLMSMGLHRLWKDRFVRKMAPRAGQKILDVAGGTGDITLRCLASTEGCVQMTVCDLNQDMIRVGIQKAIDRGWLNNPEWIIGNAEQLPIASNSMDIVCIAFGLRNVTHIDSALAEFFRTTKKGGRFFCLEFSPVITKPLQPLYDLFSFSVLPWLGEYVAKDRESYQYLAESIRQFPLPEALANRMQAAGFEQVKWESLAGGIAAIHSGWKL